MPNPEISFKEAINNLKKELPQHIEMQILKAQLCREYYIELLNQSFTKIEALELCKTFTL